MARAGAVTIAEKLLRCRLAELGVDVPGAATAGGVVDIARLTTGGVQVTPLVTGALMTVGG